LADTLSISMKVNGREYRGEVEPRRTLADFLRDDLGLTGTHLGCEQGVCGACTILMDGRSVRSCLLLAVQADGAELTTIEGISLPERLHPIQEAFWEEHGLQCGFCTPGFVMTIAEFLDENLDPTDDEIREAISGNLCRCTGYVNIVRAVRSAAAKMRGEVAAGAGSDAA
jgi:aerobic-type carbon monoxide dehydrogenase small subunit (CoxS/CutS family)